MSAETSATRQYFDMRSQTKLPFDPSKQLIVFLHLEKTAGTTVSRVIFEKSAPGHYAWRGYGQVLQLVNKGEDAPLRMLSGHFPYGVHRLMDRECIYGTMFRDPVGRLESWYYYMKRNKNSPNQARFKKLSINEWLTTVIESKDGVLHNFQAKRILGYNVPNSELGFERVKSHIENKFAFVCPYFHADDFLDWAVEPLGLTKDEEPSKGKVGSNKPKTSEIDPAIRVRLNELNVVDDRLYHWSVEHYERIMEASS